MLQCYVKPLGQFSLVLAEVGAVVFSLSSSSGQTKSVVSTCLPVLSLTLTLLNFEASGVILLPVSLFAVIFKHLTGFLPEKNI